MNKTQIFEFFRRLAEANPAPETELAYGNTYQLLVAVVLVILVAVVLVILGVDPSVVPVLLVAAALVLDAVTSNSSFPDSSCG